MEKLWRNFPHNGKTLTDFSTQWKIGECRAQVRRTPGERELYSDRRSRASKRAVASAAANFAVIFPQCGKVAAGGSWGTSGQLGDALAGERGGSGAGGVVAVE
ncbi:MAG: hypothetical protein KBF08_04715, partial [Kiritimatiellae bacterium]|nr:hypothetical protein [Kiritimatiellia bacterium]